MIDAELLLGKRLLLRAMVEDAADLAVETRPEREMGERLIVEARNEQRFIGKCVYDVRRQAEQVWARDDHVKLRRASAQRFAERRGVQAGFTIRELRFRRDLTLRFKDASVDFAVRDRIVRINGVAMNGQPGERHRSCGE